jgi:hypothetical protein
MLAFFNIAQMAEKTGFDFWKFTTLKKYSLSKAFDSLKPFISNKKDWDGPQIKKYNFEEDAVPLLIIAGNKLDCKDCKETAYKLAGKNAEQLPLNLLY